MGDYTKTWLSVDEQATKLADRGVDVEPREHTLALLRGIGYYRLTGYLYPFRDSEKHTDGADGKTRVEVLSTYRPGASAKHIARVIDFDRQLRLHVLDGVERIEVAVRMRIGYVLGRRSPLAHLDPDNFLPAFTASVPD